MCVQPAAELTFPVLKESEISQLFNPEFEPKEPTSPPSSLTPETLPEKEDPSIFGPRELHNPD
jgi:hypothetical protein